MALSKIRTKSLFALIIGMLFVVMMSGRAFAADSDFTIVNDNLVSYTGNDANVVIPDGVKTIGYAAFNGRTNMVSVTVPESVTSIGTGAFSNCSKLTTVNLPEGLVSLGDRAFEQCTSLKKITIPSTVTNIGSFAFAYTAISTVELPSKLSAMSEGVFNNCESLTSITIPEGITSIGATCFYNCTKLTTVNLPSTLTLIEKFAFNSCTSLERITIPDNVTTLEDRSFTGCTKLVYVGFPSKLERIYPSAFEGCDKLAIISLPKSLQAVGYNAFYNCKSLKTVYYAGTKAQWSAVTVRQGVDAATGIENGNNPLVKASYVYGKSTVLFNDVLADKAGYYINELQYVFARGAMTGLNASFFGVGNIVNRPTLVMILYKMEGQPKADLSKAPFTDVKTNAWYAGACAWAKETGVSTGYTDGTGRFGVDDIASRQQFMTFLYRYADYKGYDVSVSSPDTYKSKADSKDVSSWAVEAVNWGVEKGFVGQTKDNTLTPKAEINRQQAAIIIARFLQCYEEQ